jgi:phosphatidate cytidylyltransferase
MSEVPGPGSPPAPVSPPVEDQTVAPPSDSGGEPRREHGRAGRNLPAAIAVGVGLMAYLVVTLTWFKPGFVALLAVALALGSIEMHSALRRHGMHASILPIVIGTVPIAAGSYLAGRTTPVGFSTTSVLLASLALTVLACLIWRIPKGANGYVTDVAASLMIIGYVPLLGSFAALMLAGENGSARLVTFLLIVVMSDTGGYALGALFGRHPMAPKISPKKSWEGFAGSVIFGTAAGVLMTIFVLGRPFWVGLILGVALVVVGTLGDLIESMVKRDLGIKDMSSFLPGHGGVMDRLDSLLVAAPVAWLIMYLLVPGG